jgi:hypothetical protein
VYTLEPLGIPTQTVLAIKAAGTAKSGKQAISIELSGAGAQSSNFGWRLSIVAVELPLLEPFEHVFRYFPRIAGALATKSDEILIRPDNAPDYLEKLDGTCQAN